MKRRVKKLIKKKPATLSARKLFFRKKKRNPPPRKTLARQKKLKKIVKPKKSIREKKRKNVIHRRKKVVLKKIKPLKKRKVTAPVKRVSSKKSSRGKKIIKREPGAARKLQPLLNAFLPAESFFKAKIKVIGIGGGGGSIVSEIGRSLHKATFIIADTDIRAFKKKSGIKYFLFGQNLTHGLGTGVNPELGRMAAEQEKDKISHFFDDQDIVIFIASLGGGLGSGATQVFAEAAKDFHGITLGIFTLPFKFEGKNKYKIALKSLKELRKSLNVSITIPNERIFKVIEANTAITDAFSMVNENLIESLESLIDLIYSPGIINIDFADLKAILSGKGNVAFLNTAEATGKNRAEDVAQKILHNSLYQTSNFTADKILFNISGASNLSMFEVDRISRMISEKNPKAKIIFGISKNTKYKNKIKTTLLMTGLGHEIAPPGQELKIISPEVKEQKSEKSILPKKVIKKSKPKRAHALPVPPSTKKPARGKRPDVSSQEPVPFMDPFPVFETADSASNQPAEISLKKLHIVETTAKPKKAIRRTALDIKKAEEQEENKQSVQEKEWEIPAFLRKVKFKP